jgi:hypothetical protein
MHYVTEGSVRGSCGHKHRTLDGAIRCLHREGQGGYTDRSIYTVANDGAREELVELEDGSYVTRASQWEIYK